MATRKTAAFLAAGLLVTLCIALVAGIPLNWATLGDSTSPAHTIFFELRLPRALLVLVAGAALAAVGAVYQNLFHNPLAEPYLLGLSSAAVLGIASAEVLFGIAAPSALSLLIGLATAGVLTLALLAVSVSTRTGQSERLVLFGVGANFVLSSLLFLLLSYHSQNIGGGTLRWLFGQVPWLSASQSLFFSAGAGVVLLLLLVAGRALDALAFGDGVALSLGYSPGRWRAGFLLLTSALVAWLVAFLGSIGFVGLVVPHLVRLCFRPSNARALLLQTLPAGGAFLLLSDALSRSLLPPLEFPVGILTTLLGGPVLLYLLWKK